MASDVMDVKDAFADAEFLDSLSLIQNNYNLTNVQKAEPLPGMLIMICLCLAGMGTICFVTVAVAAADDDAVAGGGAWLSLLPLVWQEMFTIP